MILLLALLIGVGSLSANSNVITLPPTDDVEVRELSPDNNYGASITIWVQSAGCGKNRRTFMKFELSALPPCAIITEAKLYLYCWVAESDLNVQVRTVDNDDWAECTITWSNQPPHGKVLDTILIAKCTSFRWYCWDVTSFVRAEFSGDEVVSFCLRAEEENARGSDGFRSKEHSVATTRPYLKVVYVMPEHGMAVSISPENQSGPPGFTLNYVVTVKNTGALDDNYDLTVSDNAGWGPTLLENLLRVPAGENRQTTLSVKVPANALGCTKDNITVTATSRADNAVKDNDACIAHAKIIRNVNVSILPSYQENLPGENLIYTVMVGNEGNIADNYTLEITDNLGWSLMLENNSLAIPPFENRTTKLTVTIPENAPLCTNDNIRVVATSQENENVSAENSCIAHAQVVRGVSVSIWPSYQSGTPGATINYTVTVKNTGNAMGSYGLQKGDDLGWTLVLSQTLLENIQPNENKTATLNVTIPIYAAGCTVDNIWVAASAMENADVKDNENCQAHAAVVRSVDVSISPSENSGVSGTTLTYTVTVKNTGNVEDTYDLTVSDNAGWGPTVSLTSLTVPAGENRTAALNVTVSTNAMGCTNDTITVTATSRADNTVRDNDSCIAHATIVRGVEVLISPSYQSGLNGVTLDYIVTISNMGNVEDTYSLASADNAGWVPTVSPSSLTVPPWEDRTATLRVTVPSNAIGCTRDNVTVTATGTGVSNSASCIAHATIVRRVDASISPSYQSEAQGSALSYTVTITNTGNVVDSYALTVSDEENWGPTLDDNRFENVAPGENRENRLMILRITIPENAIPCTNDNITVTAAGTGVTDSDSCIAHAALAPMPTAPTLLSPLNGKNMNENAPTFKWTCGKNATDHRLLVDNDPDFSSPEDNVLLGATDNTWTKLAPGYSDENYSWKVIAINAAGENESDVWTFVVDTVPPPAPTLLSPADGENLNDNTPTLDWSTVTENSLPVLYYASVSDNSAFPYENRSSGWIMADQWDVSPALPDGVWYWRVMAKDNAGNIGDNSAPRSFRVDTIPPGKPTLVSPENNSVRSVLSIIFTWTRPEPDVTYHIQIDDEAGFTSPYVRENTAVGENLYAYEFASGGTYYWQVRAKDRAGNWGAWADNFKLTIQLPSGLPGKPSLISPTDGTLTNDNTPTFKWTPGENADNHRLLVDNDSNFSSPIENRLLGAVENTYTPAAGYPDGNYFWKVVAINAAGENSSAVWTFAIDATPPAKPTLMWPANGENINDNMPNLDWGAVSDASPTVLYRVRVSDNSAFPYDNVDSGWTAADNFKLTTQLKEGVWYWRVQARDNAGNVGENSATRSFRVDVTPPPPPELLEPADGAATTDTTPTFRWVAVADNSMPVTYRLQVDNDPGFSSPEIDVLGLIDNAYTPTSGLPHKNYSWRVQARDNAGNVGAWSSVRTLLITVARGVNVTISPSENGGMPGETLTYRVTVKNTGNVRDSYVLTVSDNMNWGPKLSDNRLDNVQPGENKITTLSITIPGGAVHDARDNIIVVANSLENAEVKDNASCIARATVLGVSVVISPSSASGAPKQTLTYVVVVKNTGGVKDSYSLSVADTLGWRPTLSDNSFENVLPGEERSTALSVTVPENASTDAEDEITVRATSEVDPDVSGSAQCRAIAGAAPPVPLIPLALALILILIGAAIFAIYYFRHRARAVRRLRVLRNVAAASKIR